MAFLEDIAKGGVEGFGAAIAKAVGAFKADPTKTVELEADLTKAAMVFSSSVIASVNATMQAESKSEHWLQWSWRPIGAFVFYALIINNYIFYGYLARYGVVKLDIPESVFLAFLAILGVAAWTRGQVQVVEAKNGRL